MGDTSYRQGYAEACCFLCGVGGRSVLRNAVLMAMNYNLLGTLLNVFLFIAVQGALISQSNTSQVPVELIAAALLASAAGCTVLVEVGRAIMYTWWHQVALKVYCPDAQLAQLARKYVQSTQVKMQAGLRNISKATRRSVVSNPAAQPHLQGQLQQRKAGTLERESAQRTTPAASIANASAGTLTAHRFNLRANVSQNRQGRALSAVEENA
jgi:hypothetical protein